MQQLCRDGVGHKLCQRHGQWAGVGVQRRQQARALGRRQHAPGWQGLIVGGAGGRGRRCSLAHAGRPAAWRAGPSSARASPALARGGVEKVAPPLGIAPRSPVALAAAAAARHGPPQCRQLRAGGARRSVSCQLVSDCGPAWLGEARQAGARQGSPMKDGTLLTLHAARGAHPAAHVGLKKRDEVGPRPHVLRARRAARRRRQRSRVEDVAGRKGHARRERRVALRPPLRACAQAQKRRALDESRAGDRTRLKARQRRAHLKANASASAPAALPHLCTHLLAALNLLRLVHQRPRQRGAAREQARKQLAVAAGDVDDTVKPGNGEGRQRGACMCTQARGPRGLAMSGGETAAAAEVTTSAFPPRRAPVPGVGRRHGGAPQVLLLAHRAVKGGAVARARAQAPPEAARVGGRGRGQRVGHHPCLHALRARNGRGGRRRGSGAVQTANARRWRTATQALRRIHP